MDVTAMGLSELVRLANDYRTAMYLFPVFSGATGSPPDGLTTEAKMGFLDEVTSIRDELAKRITRGDEDSILIREVSKVYYELCSIARSLSKHLAILGTMVEPNTSKLSGDLENTVDAVNFTEAVLNTYSDE